LTWANISLQVSRVSTIQWIHLCWDNS